MPGPPAPEISAQGRGERRPLPARSRRRSAPSRPHCSQRGLSALRICPAARVPAPCRAMGGAQEAKTCPGALGENNPSRSGCLADEQAPPLPAETSEGLRLPLVHRSCMCFKDHRIFSFPETSKDQKAKKTYS
ncbi:unnamed protein product [Natator depressus]